MIISPNYHKTSHDLSITFFDLHNDAKMDGMDSVNYHTKNVLECLKFIQQMLSEKFGKKVLLLRQSKNPKYPNRLSLKIKNESIPYAHGIYVGDVEFYFDTIFSNYCDDQNIVTLQNDNLSNLRLIKLFTDPCDCIFDQKKLSLVDMLPTAHIINIH